MYIAVARAYGLGMARPVVRLRSGSLYLEMLAHSEEIGVGLTALYAYLSRGRLPDVIALPERVQARRREFRLKAKRAELEAARVQRQLDELRKSIGDIDVAGDERDE